MQGGGVGPRTLFDKVWDDHVVTHLGAGVDLLFVDRHLTHDLEAGPNLARLERQGRAVRRPDLTFATPDHAQASDPNRHTDTNPTGGRLLREMRRSTSRAGIRLFDLGQTGHGIVHVIGPELGITNPGMLIVCSDSHTCTHGGLGALAFGVGASEATHVLATQTIKQVRPRTMRVTLTGARPAGVTAKDMVLRAGENVYSAEVEAAIYEHPAIHEAAVFGVPHERLGEEVATVIMLKAGETLSADEIQWDPINSKVDLDALAKVDAVIHLAGAGVGDKRWTKRYKSEILKLKHKALCEQLNQTNMKQIH